MKNKGKRKRVKRHAEPEMSKEEFVFNCVRNSQLLWGITPTEEDINKEWDLILIHRQYKKIRTQKEKDDFIEYMGQEMKRRYSPEAIAERRLRKEMEMNKPNIP